ncbi:MAG TPA: hypothetical protein VHY79_17455 [Rhizomicrobium sp.]|jgi:hypothetical protein|nr:hypothetical protein [Rhizomicrobium sp.]
MIVANSSCYDDAHKYAPLRAFPAPHEHQRKSLPRAGSPVLGGLERKYQETLGKKKQLQEAEYEWQGFDGFELAEKRYAELLTRVNSDLLMLENSIRMFDPDWTRKRLMAPRVKRTSRLLPRNAFKIALVKVMRAAKEPLTVREITALIARNLDLPMHRRDQRQRVWNMAYNALRSSHKKGHVECSDCSPAKWFAVAPRSH